MNRYARGAMITSLALVVPVTLAAPAHAEDVTVRGGSAEGPGTPDPAGDVVENRNLGSGSWEFLRDGIVQKAPTGDDRSGVYWESRTQTFPDSVSADWNGTQSADGQTADNAIVIYIDVDGDGPTPRDALLHEDIYGEGDLWLPESGSDLAKAASPGESSGSSFAGPIEEWKANLEELYGDDLEIVQVGSNLSGDGQGRSQGLLRSVTLGDDTYTFTSDAAPEPDPEPVVEDVRGGAATERVGNRLDITFTSRSPRDESATAGEKLRWRVSVNRRVEANFVQGFDEEDTFNRRFPNRTGSYEVRIVKNGEIVRTINIDTGNRR